MRTAGRVIAWPFTVERLSSIAAIVTIIGFPVAIYPLWDRGERSLRALQVARRADRQLAGTAPLRIEPAIQERRLITTDVISIWHGYAIARALENAEVRKFIAEKRREAPAVSTGIETLATEMIAPERPSATRTQRVEIRPAK